VANAVAPGGVQGVPRATYLWRRQAPAWNRAAPRVQQPDPEQILTPNTVQTRIGALDFADGVPTAETARLVYDHLDFLRGVEVFLNLTPAVIFDQLPDSNPLLLTGNTDIV
jgi:hypothetical protein